LLHIFQCSVHNFLCVKVKRNKGKKVFDRINRINADRFGR